MCTNSDDWLLVKMIGDLENPNSESYILTQNEKIPKYDIVQENGKYVVILSEV